MVSPSLLFGTDQASLTTSAGDVKGKLSASPNPSTQFCQGLGDPGIPLLSGSWQTLLWDNLVLVPSVPSLCFYFWESREEGDVSGGPIQVSPVTLDTKETSGTVT